MSYHISNHPLCDCTRWAYDLLGEAGPRRSLAPLTILGLEYPLSSPQTWPANSRPNSTHSSRWSGAGPHPLPPLPKTGRGGAEGVGPGPGAGRMDRVPPGRTACTATVPSFCRPSSGTSGAVSRALIRGSRCWWGRTVRRLRRRSGSSMKFALLAAALLGSIAKCGGGAVHLWSMHQFVQEHGEAAPHDAGRASGEARSGRGAGGHDRRGRFVRFLWKGAGRPSG